MNDSELLQMLVRWVLEQLGEDPTEPRRTALEAYNRGDDRTIKLLALIHPHDRYLDCLSYLAGARRISAMNPITGFTTLKEAILALIDLQKDFRKLSVWEEVKSRILANMDEPI